MFIPAKKANPGLLNMVISKINAKRSLETSLAKAAEIDAHMDLKKEKLATIEQDMYSIDKRKTR